MTMDNDREGSGNYVARILPWVIGGVALAGYLLTLNHWVSFGNLQEVSHICGFSWQPTIFHSEFLNPAYWVATYPLHWLPAKWVPLALNLFAALCAALTLALLARSVALLPHDRTHEQREREQNTFAILSVPLAWLPPLMAVLVCGLQTTFCEHATNGTLEMFDLLLFAYVIRAILEYRLDGRESWLARAAFAYAVGMTNNWMLVGLFPAFVAALIWVRGLSFFDPRFLTRVAIFGVIGLSLYFLVPLLASFSKSDPVNFWQALKLNPGLQKNVVMLIPKKMLLLLSLTSLLPVLVLSIRWASYFGDTSQLGVALATWIFHLVHAVFLVVCLWVTLDPPFSPRNFVPRIITFGIPFLLFYYLGALSIGYFAGYFLLVFRPIRTRGRRPSSLVPLLDRTAKIVIGSLAVLVPAALVFKNLPHVREFNGRLMRDFAALSGESLPKKGVLLTDDPSRAHLIQAWLARVGRLDDFVVVETPSLVMPGYHHYLHERYGAKWPATAEPGRKERFDAGALIEIVLNRAKETELWYLHPSFGYYFEYFYPEPHGLVHKLKRYDTYALLPPKLSPELIAENESFWEKASKEIFPRVLPTTLPSEPQRKLSWVGQIFKKLHLPPEHNAEARIAGMYLSRSLDTWAVEMQKTGDFEKSAAHFDEAQQLNPDNVVAKLNLQYNQDYRAGKRAPVEVPRNIEDQFGKLYHTWDQVLGANGPYDEPSFCYAQGYVFLGSKLYRQAAQFFERVRELAPDDLPSRLWLAQLHLMANHPDTTLELAGEIKQNASQFALNSTNRADVLCLEARAWLIKKEPARAVQILESAVQATPKDSYLLANITSVYSEHGQYSNALVNLDRQLALAPGDITSLLNKGFVYINLGAFDDAIRIMTQVLSTETNNYPALLNRAIAYRRSDKVDAALADYETLQRLNPEDYRVLFGLHDIAYSRKDTNATERYGELYLSNCVPGSAESKLVMARLKEVKGGKSPPSGKPAP